MSIPQQDVEVILVRHAPVAVPGVLAGRSDLPARLVPEDLARCRAGLPVPAALWSSPALRCRSTAEALFPGQGITQDDRLWEQDFGAWDGQPLSAMPDLGPLTLPELAAHRAPGGESFADVAARCDPAFRALAAVAEACAGPVVCVAHAGVIRAALGLVTGHVPGGLAFEIGTLSRTRFRVHGGCLAGIAQVNSVNSTGA